MTRANNFAQLNLSKLEKCILEKAYTLNFSCLGYNVRTLRLESDGNLILSVQGIFYNYHYNYLTIYFYNFKYFYHKNIFKKPLFFLKNYVRLLVSQFIIYYGGAKDYGKMRILWKRNKFW